MFLRRQTRVCSCKMWKLLVVFVTLFAICYCKCDDKCGKRKPHHHHHGDYYGHHHLLYGGGIFTYLIFLAIKVKVILVLGTIFAVVLFGGKLFAVLKLADSKTHHYEHHEPEKVYIQAPSHGHSFGGHGHVFDSVPEYSSGPIGYSSAVDKLPPGAEIADPSRVGYTYAGYKRSDDSFSLYDHFNRFSRIVRNLNVTELAFEKMNIKTEDCKKQFVCGAELKRTNNVILKTAFDIFSDPLYESYKPDKQIDSIEECKQLYPCEDQR